MTEQQKDTLHGIALLHLGLLMVAGIAAACGGSFLRWFAVTQLASLAFWLLGAAWIDFKNAAKDPKS